MNMLKRVISIDLMHSSSKWDQFMNEAKNYIARDQICWLDSLSGGRTDLVDLRLENSETVFRV